jgi:hypothetical protein
MASSLRFLNRNKLIGIYIKDEQKKRKGFDKELVDLQGLYL